ncbi:MAG: hypothetical protein A2666_03250 [Parcubacteria group bacterium RIFCSPHIGHO2_01_FULL_47_10b]|nr:MAG: hypothetical protein A2666_03250 [Parcubacteria group bacterium RIFCSPHIGHO2_01_FULL_47_10b]
MTKPDTRTALFAQIHSPTITTIKRHIEAPLPTHAFLLIGPFGIGSYEVVQSLRSQLQPPTVAHELYHELAAPIKIAAVRQLRKSLSLASHPKHYRFVTLRSFSQSTIEAQQALLKTLEEPGARILFFLLSETMATILPTIQSRAMTIRLHPPEPTKLLSALVEHCAVNDAAATRAMAMGGTNIHAMIDYCANPDSLQTILDEAATQVITLTTQPLYQRFALIKDITSREDKTTVMNIWLILLEELLTYITMKREPMLFTKQQVQTIATHGVTAQQLSNAMKQLASLQTQPAFSAPMLERCVVVFP